MEPKHTEVPLPDDLHAAVELRIGLAEDRIDDIGARLALYIEKAEKALKLVYIFLLGVLTGILIAL